jgi:hypothetical protein
MSNIRAQKSAEKKRLLVVNHRVKFEFVDAPNFGRATQERTSGGDHGINKTQLSNMRQRRASRIDRGAALKASKNMQRRRDIPGRSRKKRRRKEEM